MLAVKLHFVHLDITISTKTKFLKEKYINVEYETEEKDVALIL